MGLLPVGTVSAILTSVSGDFSGHPALAVLCRCADFGHYPPVPAQAVISRRMVVHVFGPADRALDFLVRPLSQLSGLIYASRLCRSRYRQFSRRSYPGSAAARRKRKPDNCPEYAATLDPLLRQRNGVMHVYLADFMKNGRSFPHFNVSVFAENAKTLTLNALLSFGPHPSASPVRSFLSFQQWGSGP